MNRVLAETELDIVLQQSPEKKAITLAVSLRLRNPFREVIPG